MDILGDPWDSLTREEKERWEAVGNVVRGASIDEFIRQAVNRVKPHTSTLPRLPDGAVLIYERDLEIATCEQCANPDLKGIHTCGKGPKGT